MSLPTVLDSANPVPEVVIGYVSVRSQGGTSLLETQEIDDAERFYGSESDQPEARGRSSPPGWGARGEPARRRGRGPPAAFAELTGGQIVPRERLMHTRAGRLEYVTHLDIVGGDQPDVLGVGRRVGGRRHRRRGARASARAAGVFPAPVPPTVARFHIRVPDDVATILGASQAHRRGQVGAGVKVAMVDSGHYAHPFFAAHRYAVKPAIAIVPGTSGP